MDDQVELSVPMPLDSERFLRRECPTCEREFKWLDRSEDELESDPPADGDYFCPYCAVQAPLGSWFTKPQLALIENVLSRQVVAPALDELERSLRGIGQRSGGFLQVDVQADIPEEIDSLSEPDDMRRVDFTCHPREPIKVFEEWTRPLHCLICGEPSGLP